MKNGKFYRSENIGKIWDDEIENLKKSLDQNNYDEEIFEILQIIVRFININAVFFKLIQTK